MRWLFFCEKPSQSLSSRTTDRDRDSVNQKLRVRRMMLRFPQPLGALAVGLVFCALAIYTATAANINECDARHCKNGATCVDKIDYYICICTPGYSGKNCSTDCNHIFRDASGTVSSPNYPATYFNNAFCTWNITVEEGNVVSLRFSESFSLEHESKCNYDYLEVYDGSSTSSRLIGRYCDRDIPGIIRTTGNNMYIVFRSDHDVTRQGFNGTYTSHDVDNCNPNPCQNGATCVDAVNDYSCTCMNGYSDKNCSTDIDDCTPDPCKNGATCVDKVSDYSCTCVAGYSDKNCSTDINECDPDPCKNGALCVDSINDYSCTCSDGFMGKHCNTNIDDCTLDPCKNGATCVDKVNDYSCTCVAGYSGKTCSIDINECDAGNCKNGATCVDKMNDYSCTCAPGYTGKDCSTDINECDAGNCKNGATCVDKMNDYSCTCAPGYTGKDCSTDINECDAGHCKNGATCVDKINDYSCTCTPGYTGKDCSTVNLNLILGLGLGIPLFLILCFVVGILAYWWTRKQRKSALPGSKESVSDRVSKDESDRKAGMASPFNFESKYQGKDRQIPQWRKGPVSGPFYNEAFSSYLDYNAVGDYPSYAGSRGTSGTGRVNTGEPRPDYP